MRQAMASGTARRLPSSCSADQIRSRYNTVCARWKKLRAAAPGLRQDLINLFPDRSVPKGRARQMRLTVGIFVGLWLALGSVISASAEEGAPPVPYRGTTSRLVFSPDGSRLALIY